MVDSGSLPGVPEEASEIYTALTRALGDIELSQEEREAIATYVRREAPTLLDTRSSTYLILGSYRGERYNRVQAVEHELGTRRTDTKVVVLGDTADLEIDERELPGFSVKFNILASCVDWIVMVMEKESGGESVELGRIVDGPYFSDSHVMPRDYANFVSESVESMTDAKKAAIEVWFNEHLSDSESENSIRRFAEHIADNPSLDFNDSDKITERLIEFAEQREKEKEEPSTYSWVHLSDFRKFERVGRCYPWMDEDSLREQANNIPGPGTVDWSY
ncbi:hypothetical protein [Haloarcula sebkhae]|uniref:Uncharacterized protein n=2 Tax=Haloarcula sebkhae TaxID=932660 RepID=A0A830F463_9EURY|nr:hypothetical protein [Haloarcula sebkhae]GGK83976.1 hypothetical protein GCM10009067_40190 [Haloarcula sebkhae]